MDFPPSVILSAAKNPTGDAMRGGQTRFFAALLMNVVFVGLPLVGTPLRLRYPSCERRADKRQPYRIQTGVYFDRVERTGSVMASNAAMAELAPTPMNTGVNPARSITAPPTIKSIVGNATSVSLIAM